MKITHKVMTETDFIDDIICNKCGESCINEGAASPDGLIEIHVRGGYGSNALGDGADFTFSICEKCLVQVILGFKVPPDFYDCNDHDFTFEEWHTWATKQLGGSILSKDTPPT